MVAATGGACQTAGMKRKWLLALLVLTLGGAAGGFTWWKLRPAPEPTAEDQRKFEDIPKNEYEEWMQDLGYTE